MDVHQSSQELNKQNTQESNPDRRTPPIPSAPHHAAISGQAKNAHKPKRPTRKPRAAAPIQPILATDKMKPLSKSFKKPMIVSDSEQRNPGEFRDFLAVDQKAKMATPGNQRPRAIKAPLNAGRSEFLSRSGITTPNHMRKVKTTYNQQPISKAIEGSYRIGPVPPSKATNVKVNQVRKTKPAPKAASFKEQQAVKKSTQDASGNDIISPKLPPAHIQINLCEPPVISIEKLANQPVFNKQLLSFEKHEVKQKQLIDDKSPEQDLDDIDFVDVDQIPDRIHHQEYEPIKGIGKDINGDAIDRLPNLESKFISDGEENIMATLRPSDEEGQSEENVEFSDDNSKGRPGNLSDQGKDQRQRRGFEQNVTWKNSTGKVFGSSGEILSKQVGKNQTKPSMEQDGQNLNSLYFLKADKKKYQRYFSVDIDKKQDRPNSPPPDLTDLDQEEIDVQNDIENLSQTDKKSDHIIKMRRCVRKHPDRAMINASSGKIGMKQLGRKGSLSEYQLNSMVQMMEEHENRVGNSYVQMVNQAKASKIQTQCPPDWAVEVRKLDREDPNNVENIEDGVNDSNEFENTINLSHTKSPRATWVDRKVNPPQEKFTGMLGKKLSVEIDKIDHRQQDIAYAQSVPNHSFKGTQKIKPLDVFSNRDNDHMNIETSKSQHHMFKTQNNMNISSLFKINNNEQSDRNQPDQSLKKDDNEQFQPYQSLDGGFKMMKRDARINSVVSGQPPNSSNIPKPAFGRKASINLPKDMNQPRGSTQNDQPYNPNQIKKRYQMDKKSTQTELTITKKDIKFITVNMLNMNLKEVNFSQNKIIYLPDEMCELVNLEKLDLEKNNLRELPQEFGYMRKMKDLNLSNNELRSLPDSLSRCRDLEQLSLNDNKLEILPNNLGDCSKLKVLHIQNNKLTQIPSSLSRLVNISAITFEWFMYLDPPQQQFQNGIQGQYIIEMLWQFCRSHIEVYETDEDHDVDQVSEVEQEKYPASQELHQRPFLEFICYFHICKMKKFLLTRSELIQGVNSIKFHAKHRCLVQATCSNKHPHLMKEILTSNSNGKISRIINENIDLNIPDNQDQTPLLGCLRQGTSDYAKILLDSKSIHPVELNIKSLKHGYGYPLHMAILLQKFDIASQLLEMRENIDPHCLNTVGANIVHLLFVKYDKDSPTALQILNQCLNLGVNVNLVDQMQTAPIHIALRKKQYQAIKDIIQMNKDSGKQIFDLNIRDRSGLSPLHFVVEKQDYTMFLILLEDPYIDVNQVELDKFLRPRRLSVIFSAFHKILYQKEKFIMKRQFQEDINDFYIDFKGINRSNSMYLNDLSSNTHTAPAPISVSNKAKSTKHMNFSNQAYSTVGSKRNSQNQISGIHNQYERLGNKFDGSNRHEAFYDQLTEDNSQFVSHGVLNVRQLRKQRQKQPIGSNFIVKPKPPNLDLKILPDDPYQHDGRGSIGLGPISVGPIPGPSMGQTVDGKQSDFENRQRINRSISLMSKFNNNQVAYPINQKNVSQNYNTSGQYFQQAAPKQGSTTTHKRQKSVHHSSYFSNKNRYADQHAYSKSFNTKQMSKRAIQQPGSSVIEYYSQSQKALNPCKLPSSGMNESFDDIEFIEPPKQVAHGIGGNEGPFDLSPSNGSTNGPRDEYQIGPGASLKNSRVFNQVHQISGQRIPQNAFKPNDSDKNYYSVHSKPQPVKLQKSKPIGSSFGPRPASIGSFLSNSDHQSANLPGESAHFSGKQQKPIDDVDLNIPKIPSEPDFQATQQIQRRGSNQWAARPASRDESQKRDARQRGGQTQGQQEQNIGDQSRPGMTVGSNQTKIYISNLNINLNNVFINMNDQGQDNNKQNGWTQT